MTTAVEEERKCAVCGNTSKQWVMTSTSAFGVPKLDTRPPAPEGYSLEYWIQTCPSCGYCAPDISERIEGLLDEVSGESYRKQLNDQEFPELANAFLCCSLLEESTGKYTIAGWECIHDAWVCDDIRNEAGAQKCRKRAITLLQNAQAHGQSLRKGYSCF